VPAVIGMRLLWRRVLGCHPVFADIDPSTFASIPTRSKQAIQRPHSRDHSGACVRIHGPIWIASCIARARDIRVIETVRMSRRYLAGKGVGSIGDVGSFSFQQSKQMASAEGASASPTTAEIADRIFA